MMNAFSIQYKPRPKPAPSQPLALAKSKSLGADGYLESKNDAKESAAEERSETDSETSKTPKLGTVVSFQTYKSDKTQLVAQSKDSSKSFRAMVDPPHFEKALTHQELLAENALLQKNVTRLKKTLADTTAQLSDITRETETFRANQTKMNSELSFHKDKTSLTSRHLTRARAESMNLTKESQSKDKDIEALNKRIKKLETQLSLMTRTEPSLTDIDAEREELLVLREEKEYLLDYLDQMISVLDGKPKDPIGPPGVRESVQRLHRLQKQVDSEKEIREKENTYALVAGASIFACVAIISRWFLNSL